MTLKYIAKMDYGQATLAQIEIIKETDKTITWEGESRKKSITYLVGSFMYLPSRISKADYHIFGTPEAALAWLIAKNEEWIKGAEQELERVKNQDKMLNQKLAALKEEGL